ncbi:hydroxyacylglutathione hydrolase [Pollutimonas subterranea]|uniref:Hydroxyacylglutathione hydrolase n=1 Tax=Pollutimonas subterranea TaxID=2045210 RepID=A0A2N4U6G8_9BURK|nr:FAD/NAD(P)-binding protein [Pollutimonas subterranea]PLC50589.1 hydroxyacylglutathione hydrolase [Pollutimonas subterranea]
MEKPADLAVVGGGSTAISFLAQLIAALGDEARNGGRQILVFEPRLHVGPGEPYAPDLASNLLNIPAGKMSAYANDRGHFLRWIENRGAAILQKYGVNRLEANAFLPRPLFGEYLQDVWTELLGRARQLGIDIRRVQARVEDIVPASEDGSVCLQTPAGNFIVRRVVLCNGNLPSVSYTNLHDCPGYFNTPYPVADLAASMGREAHVAVIGTSLSAVDAIVALKESGHTGSIVAVSRSGRLPAVRSTVALPMPVVAPSAQQIATMCNGKEQCLTLEAIFSFLLERLDASGDALDLADIVGQGDTAKEMLQYEIIASSTRARSWQAVAISLNDAIEHLWRAMPDTERRRFQAEWRSLWMTRRATFPMVNALKIQSYLNDGSLEIAQAGSDLSISAIAGGFAIRLRGADGRLAGRHVDFVVNATGMSTDVSVCADPLLRSLLARGVACADPYGGLKLDFHTGCLLDAKGGVVQSISVLGSLAAGTYFWTVSLDVNARLAFEQAARLAREWSAATVPAEQAMQQLPDPAAAEL